ncbi:MAG: hypothetical protein PHI12_07005 [Dehalococcoidales bacterium]|nr:hypothetical protein [Dehalococcoidales bacterium]
MNKKHEAIVGKGIRIERHGRFIYTDTRRSEAEHKEILTAFASMVPELEKTIPQRADQLRRQLKAYNSFDVIANVVFQNLFVNPEQYKEYSHEGLQFVVEYTTLLCLMDAFSEGGNPSEQAPLDLGNIQNTVKGILNDTLLYAAAIHINPDNPNPPTLLEKFQYQSFSRNLTVRNPGYSHQQTEVLRALFSFEPVGNWMKAYLGFEIEDVLGFIEAIERIMNGRLSERRKQAIESKKEIRREVRLFSQGKLNDSKYPKEMLSGLAKLSEKKMLKRVKHMLTAWVFFGLGATFSFTAEELAKESGRDVETTGRFLACFSIGFGEVSPEFVWPSPTHPLRLRPIVHHGGRYICAATALLLWGAKATIEELLNPASAKAINKDYSVWEKFQKHRANYLVSEGVRLISEIVKYGKDYRNLRYRVEENDQLKDTDLDGLVLYDRHAFLVEGKAGVLTEPTKRGAPDRMVSDIRKLIVESHAQAIRADKYITINPQPAFQLPDGQELRIDKQNLDTNFLVTITLEPLDTFAPVLYQVAELGVFGEGRLPWAVYLLDLKVIAELIEFPSQFIHYLNQRLRINELANIEAFDELDWLGYYLHEGLYFEDLQESGIDHFQLLSYTTDMDSYFMYKTGERTTPAPKPTQCMPQTFRKMILELDSKHPLGYCRIINVLLNISFDTRKKIAKWFERARHSSERDGRIHDFTITLSGTDIGITVMTCRDHSPQDFERRLQAYGQLKKYQLHAGKWIVIGSHIRLPGLAQFWEFTDAPWHYDSGMEKLLQSLPR